MAQGKFYLLGLIGITIHLSPPIRQALCSSNEVAVLAIGYQKSQRNKKGKAVWPPPLVFQLL